MYTSCMLTNNLNTCQTNTTELCFQSYIYNRFNFFGADNTSLKLIYLSSSKCQHGMFRVKVSINTVDINLPTLQILLHMNNCK